MPTMPEKPTKITCYVPERVRRALAIVSAERNISIGDLLRAWVEGEFPEQLKRADQNISEGKPGTGKRGRKPKPPD